MTVDIRGTLTDGTLPVPFTDTTQVSIDDYIKFQKFPPCVLAKGLFPAMKKLCGSRVLIAVAEVGRCGAGRGVGRDVGRGEVGVEAVDNESLEGLY